MSTLKDTIEKREQTPISFDEIMLVLSKHNNPPNFVMLDDLSENPTDDNLFKGKNSALILCTLHTHGHVTNINHWVSIIRRPREYWFYDSLANTVEKLTTRLANGKQSLVNWKRGKRVRENKVRTQKMENDINTCGCHQAVRLARSDLNPINFIRWLTHGFLDPDISVAMMTYLDLLK